MNALPPIGFRPSPKAKTLLTQAREESGATATYLINKCLELELPSIIGNKKSKAVKKSQ